MSERPKGNCIDCKPKVSRAIYTHLDGDPNLPLCQACNMRRRRASAGSEQAKRLRVMATLVAGTESALAFSLDEQERQEFVEMQEKLKLRVRYWLGDGSAATNSLLKKRCSSMPWLYI
jgi:hypothetical protein